MLRMGRKAVGPRGNSILETSCQGSDIQGTDPSSQGARLSFCEKDYATTPRNRSFTREFTLYQKEQQP